jgi:hypothetical protein
MPWRRAASRTVKVLVAEKWVNRERALAEMVGQSENVAGQARDAGRFMALEAV